jgi:glucosyl-dolichyl phosphate glucuronosyltransferase
MRASVMTPMRLDVLIPTYNRANLLARACESLLAAERPANLDVRVTVLDNRSTDGTRAVVESFMPKFEGRLHYLYEARPGRSIALNSGIAATSGDLVGIIDDDEEVDRRWLRTIAEAFTDPATDFIGGPYVPRWGSDRPAWLGTAHKAAIGWVDSGSDIRPFGPDFPGILMGGNAVIKRTVLDRVGAFAIDLGRSSDGRLLSCEDRDMYDRLLAIGARGFYRPDLVILHYVPPERLTKSYFRRWCFWHGVSLGVLDRRRPAQVPYLFGVPRYMIGVALRAVGDMARRLFSGEPARRFHNELACWDLVGFFYGKHLFRA